MKRNIYIRIRGGLGNQLFEYSFAYLLSRECEDYDLYLDVREMDGYYWPLGLVDFKLDGKTHFLSEKIKYDSAIKRYHLYQFLYRKLLRRTPNELNKRLLKKGFLFCGRDCDLPKNELPENIYLYGYFQNASLLETIRGDMTKLISLKEPTNQVKHYISMINEDISVSVSIRVAKEIELKKGEKYTYSNKEYYLTAINRIKEKRGKVQLVISSNDVDRIKSEHWFDDIEDIVYITNCSPSEQLEIMKYCRDFVMSNSTFSWWIAYLGSYGKDSLIFSPSKWFENEDIHKTKIMFNNMEVIDCV